MAAIHIDTEQRDNTKDATNQWSATCIDQSHSHDELKRNYVKGQKEDRGMERRFFVF